MSPERKMQMLQAFIEAQAVIEWLVQNGDLKKKDMTKQQIRDLAIEFAAGPNGMVDRNTLDLMLKS